MHDLMNWDDDEPRDRIPAKPQAMAAAAPASAVPKAPSGNSTGEPVTFRDVMSDTWREGTVIRTIQSCEHDNAYLGHLPVVTLYLVVYTNEKQALDYAVITDRLIKAAPKPRA